MQRIIITILSVISVSLAGRLPSFFQSRIVNGEDAVLGEIPYQVSLQNAKHSHHFCGGSILNENYVITAAHCVYNEQPETIKIIAATVNLKDPRMVHKADEIIVHKKFNRRDSWVNDIALIKVKEKFVVTETLSFVPLPSEGHIISQGSVAQVSGWGNLWGREAKPDILQKAEIIIAPQNYCKKVYEERGINIYDSHICAYDPEVSTGSCYGDSGGPLVVNEKLVGIVSWGSRCGSKVYPIVYTRITEYIDWIEKNTV